jgi:hypothetical protein
MLLNIYNNTAFNIETIKIHIIMITIERLKSFNGTLSLVNEFFLELIKYPMNRTSILVTKNAPHMANTLAINMKMTLGTERAVFGWFNRYPIETVFATKDNIASTEKLKPITMIYKLLYNIIANDVKMFDKVSILLFDIND